MRKAQLLGFLLCVYSVVSIAQTTEIFAPDFRYENNQRGYITYNVTAVPELNGDDSGNADLLWKRIGNVPTEVELGYTRSTDFKSWTRSQRALKCQSHIDVTIADKSIAIDDSVIYKTESYVIVDPVDLSLQSAQNDFEVTFASLLSAKGTDAVNSTFDVLLSTDYSDDFTTATWSNITDQITLSTNIGEWTNATFNLNDYKNETVTLAYKYKVDITTELTKTNMPAVWQLSDVRFTTTAPDLSAYEPIYNFLFKDGLYDYNIKNTVGDVAKWTRNGGKLPENSEDGENAIKVSAVTSGSNNQLATWAVLPLPDLTTYKNDVLVSFYNQVEWLGTTGTSELKVMMSMTHTPKAEITENQWVDVTSQFNIDQANHTYVKSQGILDIGGKADVHIAFVYINETEGATTGATDRASTWYIANIEIAAQELASLGEYSEINNWKFDNFDQLAFANTINNTIWSRTSATAKLPTDAVDGDHAVKVSAVITVEDTKMNSKLEAWTLLGNMDLSNYTGNVHLSFQNKVEYLGKTGSSNLRVMLSTSHIAGNDIDVNEWSDISTNFDINQANHDYVSTAGYIDAAGEANVHIAFVYLNETEGIAESTADRASTWYIADVMLKGVGSIPTAIAPINDNGQTLSIYPNPATTTVNFSASTTKVNIYTLSGKSVYNTATPCTSVDVSSLTSGVYIIRTQTSEGKISTSQLIIE